MSVTATKRAKRESKDPAQRTRDKLFIDVPFTKAAPMTADTQDGSGDIILSGYASTWAMDRDQEAVVPGAFDASLGDYLNGNPIVLWQHDMDTPIGTITSAKTDSTGLYVEALIPNPGPNASDAQKGAYNAIRLGIVKTFSIGGYFTRDITMGPEGPVFTIVAVELFEVSCVSIPANAGSIYEAVIKSFNEEPPGLHPLATEQLKQLIGFTAITDPQLATMTSEERDERFKQLSILFQRAHDGAVPPPLGAYIKATKAGEAGIAPMVVVGAKAAIVRSFFLPETDEKAGRTISAANQGKLQSVMGHQRDMENHLIDAAESMKAVAQAHGAAMDTLSDVLGVTAEGDPSGGTEDDDQEEDGAPEKGAVVPDEKAGLGGSDPDDGMKVCPTCKGKGKIRAGNVKCPDCKGSGQVAEDWKPKGVSDADQKLLASQTQQALSSAGKELLGKDPDKNGNNGTYVYLDDFDPDNSQAVFATFGSDYMGGGDYVQVPYSQDAATGKVTLDGDNAKPVVPQSGYVPKGLCAEERKTFKFKSEAAPDA